MITRIASDIGEVALWTASIGIVVFIAQYTLMTPWWRRQPSLVPGGKPERNLIAYRIIGLDLCLLLIFIPSLIAAVVPIGRFAGTRWYLWLSIFTVVFTAVFVIMGIVKWEQIRRQRRQVNGHGLGPGYQPPA